jgi:FKBP-type peptidyl-prolyl cis-trans isomerase 2
MFKEGNMKNTHRNNIAIVALMTVLTCLGILSQPSLAAGKSVGNARIIDGSNVTLMFQITIPGEQGFVVRDIGKFVQGRHELLPALERVVTGMKSGDEKNVELSVEEAFGPYDGRKKKTVPRDELPPQTKEGDVLQDRAGYQATVAQLSDTSAVMDYNHPLAGKPLIVKIRILRVDDPS